jgi:hypothetical protein
MDIYTLQVSIKAALMKSATQLPYESYIVGAGRANLQAAKNLISSLAINGSYPALTYIHPQHLPIDYEKLFYGDVYTFK